MFSSADNDLLQARGITPERMNEMMQRFRTGFPPMQVAAAATPGNGICQVASHQQTAYTRTWDDYCATGHTIVKFVPASGAASRMFKMLFAFLEADRTCPETPEELTFFEHITRFAFFDDLDTVCQRRGPGKGVLQLINDGCYKEVVRALLDTDGLNYGHLPKGLLKFHHTNTSSRTAAEEHLSEGACYAAGADGKVRVHFTVSPQHLELFRTLTDECKAAYEEPQGLRFIIDFSTQQPSTDTPAATEENEPFRVDGQLLFRPGGHGALIANLNAIDADVVFIKNIDNVVPDHLKQATVHYKKLLAGIMVTVQQKLFAYLHSLQQGTPTPQQLDEMLEFLTHTLCCRPTPQQTATPEETVALLRRKFNRPLRVCAMVPNSGEAGGGPFLTYSADGSIAPQILEEAQIPADDTQAQAALKAGTHFNPVDIVCGLKDYLGHPFDLTRFVDPDTGFISNKSHNGRVLKALELPGLWNGAMSDWNTLFVEVPLETFNPVKTVNDLLRPAHQ